MVPAPASARSKKAPFKDTSNARIDSYFKPCSSRTKRRLVKDENTSFNDENRKKTPPPASSQDTKSGPLKRQFGDIKSNDTNITNARSEQSTKRQFGEIKSSDENAKKTSLKQMPLKRQFGDIKYNDENMRKTPSPSNSQQQQQPKHELLKKQFGDTKSNAYTALRLPLMDKSPKMALKSQSPEQTHGSLSSKRAPAFAVLCDEDIEKGIEKAPTPPSALRVFSDSQGVHDSQEAELDTQSIQEGDLNNTQWTEVTSSPISIFPDDEDEDFPPVVVYNDKENTRNTENVSRTEKDDEEDDEEDDNDLFVKTDEGTINFKPVMLDKITSTSSNTSRFFSDEEEEDDTQTETGPSFFDEDQENSICNKDDDFSVTVNEDQANCNNDDDFSVTINNQTSDANNATFGPTLSPDSCETASQIHIPYNNPRGEGPWEKEGPDNTNENESEDPDSDDLPSW